MQYQIHKPRTQPCCSPEETLRPHEASLKVRTAAKPYEHASNELQHVWCDGFIASGQELTVYW